jgi:hypothetical protein
VAIQHGWIKLWTVVDNEAMRVDRTFYIAATGELLPMGHYIGTVHDKALVWHVFEIFPEVPR